jgi:4-diphosphocytidyl-2-C-methyl-D-erythritol kinase
MKARATEPHVTEFPSAVSHEPPETLSVRSFAKVNLALAVLEQRQDGFHEIRTVFQSIDLHDTLELRRSSTLELECRGLSDVPPEQNLVWKAASALMAAIPSIQGARITLRKTVPPGSGLGGGSSNAAATLLGLCRLWNVDADPALMHRLASALGSDVPFFLQGGTALGAGRGDEVYPVPELPEAHLVVVYPGLRVPTAEAYAMLTCRLTPDESHRKIYRFCSLLQAGLDCLSGAFNDFERVVLDRYDSIREARDFLLEHGAVASLLSGSGSSVFGFFLEEESALAASNAVRREEWRVFPAKTLSRLGFFQRMFA